MHKEHHQNNSITCISKPLYSNFMTILHQIDVLLHLKCPYNTARFTVKDSGSLKYVDKTRGWIEGYCFLLEPHQLIFWAENVIIARK